MANNRRRSLRAALVVCAPPLARIHERIFQALDLHESGEFGRPGGGSLFLSHNGVNNCASRATGGRLDERSVPGSPEEARRDVEISCSASGDARCTFRSDDEDLFTRGVGYFASEWLSKLDDRDKSRKSARLATTWDRFKEAESLCFKVNQEFARSWRNSPYSREINLARKIASKILGPFDWDSAARGFGWGPGATTRLTRRLSDAAHKYSGSPHATIGNAVLANAVLDWTPLWKRELPLLSEDEGVGYVKIVPGNRVVTVPKNYKTDRTIAIEPDMNIYVQKGIGSLLRSRLQAIGVNLNDQTKNQRMAQIGSFAGRLATIDLSMASDCISRSLVEVMIRPDWLEPLGQSRSQFGVLPSGEKIFYQKFSSMGNGYTFELESLIFYSLALAHVHLNGGEVDRICAYGDDLIVPSAMAVSFCGLLQFVGFKPNEKKSYWEGSFRESCGKHYYRGYDITPFYVKKTPKTLIDLFKIHNQLWRYVVRCHEWLGPERSKRLMEVCKWLRSFAPARWRRPSIVDGIGDGGFVGFFDEVCPSVSRHGWDGYVVDCIVTSAVPDEDFSSHGLLVKSLSRLERREPSRDVEVFPRGSTLISDELESIEVLPVKGQRYASGKVFFSTSLLHRQCSGLFYPK